MQHEEYIKRRDELCKIRSDSENSFDKALLTLSTGSLALSIAFLDKIGRPYDFWTALLIFISWGAFFLVILLNLFSYYFAQKNMDLKIQDLDSSYQKEIDTKQVPDTTEKIFWQRKAVNYCNFSSLIFFGIGVFTFLGYISLLQIDNYSIIIQEQGREMVDKKSNAKTEVKAPIVPSNKILTNLDLHTAGKTEPTQDIVKPITSPVKIKEGKTEPVQAIIKPDTSSEKK